MFHVKRRIAIENVSRETFIVKFDIFYFLLNLKKQKTINIQKEKYYI